MGIIFALIALLSWGFGDFFIQKTVRHIGSWKALFFIGVVGFFSLFPFVKNDVLSLSGNNLLLLTLLGVVVVFTALFDFEALRKGKIAIIEPIIGLELPLTVGLSIILGHEHPTMLQFSLIGMVFVGIMLAITQHYTHLHGKRIFEKGVVLAGVGAIGMALTNFLVGVSSQGISPLMTVWFAHSLLAVVCGIYLLTKGEFGNLLSDIRAYPKPIIGQSILDNVAWVAFAFSTTLIPISIATTISESYVALAVLLGIFINREKLKSHQIAGVIFVLIGVSILSYLSS